MNRLHWLVVVVVALASASAGQEKIFEWVKASDEAAQLDPMDYHAGRVYHPADSGGNMHVTIHARMPVTVAMAPNDQWMAVTQHPEQPAHLELICTREHRGKHNLRVPPARRTSHGAAGARRTSP